jgi:hypothetical protein
VHGVDHLIYGSSGGRTRMKVARIVVIAAALGVALLPGTALASGGWQLTTTPNPGGHAAGLSANRLIAVSCLSVSDCIAAGDYTDLSNNTVVGRALAETWNGVSWSQQSTPDLSGMTSAQFLGIKCVSANFCMAVGDSHDSSGNEFTLAESWNGTNWTDQLSPDTDYPDQLNAVACTTTANCMAVGYYSQPSSGAQPLAFRWNGTAWSFQNPTVSGGRLLGISCTSASACTAVGYAGSNALALRWNGSTWKTQAVPKPTGAKSIQLNAVKCTSGTVCTAVGFSSPGTGNNPLAERWNGTSWKVQPTPEPPGGPGEYTLAGVSCTSASACTAVGDYGNGLVLDNTLAEYWNGTAWKVQSTPNVDAFNVLSGVSCPTATCMAVGNDSGDSGSSPILTLAMQRT